MIRLFEQLKHVEAYSLSRPATPKQVAEKTIQYLLGSTASPENNAASEQSGELKFDLMVDVGCGSGQSTDVFAPYFTKIVGVDPSPNQIQIATSKSSLPNIVYQTGSAENLDVASSSVDLVTSGQAVHWLDLKAFFNECHRVLKPSGCLLLHGYDRPHLLRSQDVDKTADSLFTTFYKRCKFHARRKHIDDHYSEIHSMIRSDHTIRKECFNLIPCKLSDFVSYLETWSGYKSYLNDLSDANSPESADILQELVSSLKIHWDIGPSIPNQEIDLYLRYPIFMILSQRPHLT